MDTTTRESIDRVKSFIDPTDELGFMETEDGDIYLVNRAGEPQYRFVPRGE
jgi:hypothetical protein